MGAILMGDKSEFPEFKDLIENGVELSEKRMQLLRSGKTQEPMVGKLVCSCNNVGTGNIQKVIDTGCTQLNELCTSTGAGLGCGSCKGELQNMINKTKALEKELINA